MTFEIFVFMRSIYVTLILWHLEVFLLTLLDVEFEWRSVRLLLTLEKFISCLNRTLESHRYYSWFSIYVVSLGWFKLFLLELCNLNARILKLNMWFAVLFSDLIKLILLHDLREPKVLGSNKFIFIQRNNFQLMPASILFNFSYSLNVRWQKLGFISQNQIFQNQYHTF